MIFLLSLRKGTILNFTIMVIRYKVGRQGQDTELATYFLNPSERKKFRSNIYKEDIVKNGLMIKLLDLFNMMTTKTLISLIYDRIGLNFYPECMN